MKRIMWLLLVLTLALGLGAPAGAATKRHPSMKPGLETWKTWMARHQALPEAPLQVGIASRLASGAALGLAESFSLLPLLSYAAKERDQGYCGNCWVWAGTAILEVALAVQKGISERLSIQYLNSCYRGPRGYENACCGAEIEDFALFYAAQGLAIPWSNPNAWFQDGEMDFEETYDCDRSSFQSCGSLVKTPYYLLSSVKEEYLIGSPVVAQKIALKGKTKEEQIATIKNVLLQNKAIWFAFALPTDRAWDDLDDYWEDQTEHDLFAIDAYLGRRVSDEPDGHAVVVVGYDDAARAWVLINSWGTGENNNRPQGLFRVSMDMNYDGGYRDRQIGRASCRERVS
jgi:hypothetical protein